jgi:hypothetical protein
METRHLYSHRPSICSVDRVTSITDMRVGGRSELYTEAGVLKKFSLAGLAKLNRLRYTD